MRGCVTAAPYLLATGMAYVGWFSKTARPFCSVLLGCLVRHCTSLASLLPTPARAAADLCPASPLWPKLIAAFLVTSGLAAPGDTWMRARARSSLRAPQGLRRPYCAAAGAAAFRASRSSAEQGSVRARLGKKRPAPPSRRIGRPTAPFWARRPRAGPSPGTPATAQATGSTAASSRGQGKASWGDRCALEIARRLRGEAATQRPALRAAAAGGRPAQRGVPTFRVASSKAMCSTEVNLILEPAISVQFTWTSEGQRRGREGNGSRARPRRDDGPARGIRARKTYALARPEPRSKTRRPPRGRARKCGAVHTPPGAHPRWAPPAAAPSRRAQRQSTTAAAAGWKTPPRRRGA